MKIAHISDLHIDINYKQANLKNVNKLFEYLYDEKFDHVVVTGDITENAEPSAFEFARKLFQKYGLMNSDKLTLVIGNHDIYGGVHLAEDILNYPSKCRNTNYKRQIEQFEYYFSESFKNCTRLIEGTLFPYVKILDELMFIGMNSIAEYSVIRNPFASNGKISRSQLNALELIDNISGYNPKKRILLTHHHFCKDTFDVSPDSGSLWPAIERQTMKLRNKKKLIKKFRNSGIDTVLHGHLHETKEYKRKGIRCFNGGGSVFTGISGLLSFNDLRINNNNIYRQQIDIESPLTGELNDKTSITTNFTPKVSFSKEICLN
jgi:3',5'-cyclic AMP phosphodiesterase CpdA